MSLENLDNRTATARRVIDIVKMTNNGIDVGMNDCELSDVGLEDAKLVYDYSTFLHSSYKYHT